jgi:hypothetical protein
MHFTYLLRLLLLMISLPQVEHLELVLALQQQVSDLEQRNLEREGHLNRLLEQAKAASSDEVSHLKVYYSEALVRKNREIEHFKNELDDLLSPVSAAQTRSLAVVQQTTTTIIDAGRRNMLGIFAGFLELKPRSEKLGAIWRLGCVSFQKNVSKN